MCAPTKSAKLCSSCQPTAVAALCCAVVCTPCQGTDSSPSLTQKNTTMLYNNTVMDFCFKNDWMHCQKKCLFFDFFRCYFGRKNEKSQNLFSTKIFRKMQTLVCTSAPVWPGTDNTWRWLLLYHQVVRSDMLKLNWKKKLGSCKYKFKNVVYYQTQSNTKANKYWAEMLVYQTAINIWTTCFFMARTDFHSRISGPIHYWHGHVCTSTLQNKN